MQNNLLLSTLADLQRGAIPLPRALQGITIVKPHSHQGRNSFALLATTKNNTRCVLKIAPLLSFHRNSLKVFEKEKWLSSVLLDTEEKIGFPRTIATGSFEGTSTTYAFLLQEKLPGTNALDFHRGYNLNFMGYVGALAKRVNQIPVFGFGSEVKSCSFSHRSWGDFIESEIENSGFYEVCARGIIKRRTEEMLSTRFAALSSFEPEATLAHQDFAANWGNLLLTDSTTISGLVDWEYAVGGWGTLYELSSTLYTLYRNGLSPLARSELFSAFLEGYGLELGTYIRELRYAVETDVLRRCVSALWKYESALTWPSSEAIPVRLPQAQRAAKLLDAFSSSDEVHLF